MIGGHERQYLVAPRPAGLLAFGLTLADLVTALERNNANVGAGYIERFGEQYLVRVAGPSRRIDEIRAIRVATSRRHTGVVRDVAEVYIGKDLRTGAATMNGEEVVLGTVFMLMGENSRIVARAAADKTRGDQCVAAGRPAADAGVRPHDARRQDHRHGADEPVRGCIARRRRAVRCCSAICAQLS